MKYKILAAILLSGVSLRAQVASVDGWKKLTLREKIGQTMIMLPDRKMELQLGNGSLPGFFKRYPVTGFFMGWKLFQGVDTKDKISFIKQAATAYQQASTQPLIFQQDYEHGVALPGMTGMPYEMAIGAANSPQLTYNYGKTLAMESRSVGIQWVLHPMADLNLNPLNPIVNVRGISDDPDRAIRLLSRQVKGLQYNGVAATIKHFPGDGVDYRDQHLTTTTNSLTMSEWYRYHGKVFQALIDSGVAAIMPGHITLPAYQKQKLNGFLPPATLSHELLTGLLKNEMHFKGVIISDAMTMGGFRGWFPNQLEGEIASFKAGVDVLLWPSYSFMDTLEARIKRNEIPMSRLDDAVSRIWAMKVRYNAATAKRQLIKPMSIGDKAFARATSDSICAAAVTLVRDRDKSLPLSKNVKKILVVGVVPQSRKGGDGGLAVLKNFATQLGQKGYHVDFQHNLLYENQGWDEQVSKQYDKVIFAVVRQPHTPFGPLQLYDDEAQSAWAVNAMPKSKVIVISFGSPYILNEYFERVNTCINAYSNNEEMHNAVIKVLTGEAKANGTSPVNLQNNAFKKYSTIE
ncbi:glycoside hydrolase family 3 protein [Mucilaginibacter aquatilis]|uniref:beta-N-acetylhexosaminidase n=1 Tax=Mucilaginibacter aquatilis TaxID=1517760 RepID=A0A6I4IBW6_9SPHI|nr:glycoside hydrolase family 3 N-terminal domain-containing protein [Mucilaginibacter aquatilis]MVN92725.1 glycoside hydrolase family 3 protein [Mucilaginibacter aquatilis]